MLSSLACCDDFNGVVIYFLIKNYVDISGFSDRSLDLEQVWLEIFENIIRFRLQEYIFLLVSV